MPFAVNVPEPENGLSRDKPKRRLNAVQLAEQHMRKSSAQLDDVLFEVQMNYPLSFGIVPLTGQFEQTAPGVYGKIITELEDQPWYLAVFRWEKGSMLPPHQHPDHHEDIIVKSGCVEMKVGEDRYEMGPMSYMFVPAGATHSTKALEPVVMLVRWFQPGEPPPDRFKDMTTKEVRAFMHRFHDGPRGAKGC